MKLTIIGTGKMAKAIIEGVYKEIEVEVVGRNEKILKFFKDKYGVLIKPLDDYDISDKKILLGIKPFALKEISKKLKGEAEVLISILAGVKIDTLKDFIKAKHYVRAMPNLAAAHQKSMTTLTGDIAYKKESLFICKKFGKALWLNSEKELDIATAIAGSGPAFLSIVAEALSDGGVSCGLKREDSEILTKGLFEGFFELLKNKSSFDIKKEVMSPGGTTAAGIEALEKERVRYAFIKAVKKAYKRAKK